MASSGLLAALGGAAKYGLKQEERKQDEESERRKLQMQMQLQQQLMKAKTQYAKENPQFNKYITNDLTGDVYGFDEFGGSKLVMPASEEEKKIRSDARAAETNYKKAQADKYNAEADTLGILKLAQANQANARAGLYDVDAELRPSRVGAQNYKDTKQGDAAGKSKTPSQRDLPKADMEIDAEARKLVADVMPEFKDFTPTPNEPEYAVYSAALERARKELKAKYGGQSTSPEETNDFNSLVPSGDGFMIKRDLFSN